MMPLAFLGNMGMGEWIIILCIVLLLFGSAKLPALFRSMGSSVHEFKKGMKEGNEDPATPDASVPAPVDKAPGVNSAHKN